MGKDIKRKIIFFGELPPTTIHGISLSNRRILDLLSESYIVDTVEDKSSFGGVFAKITSLICALICILRLSNNKYDVLYLNMPTSILGLVKARIICMAVLLFSPNCSIVAHLHRGDVGRFLRKKGNLNLFRSFSNRLDVLLVLSNTSKIELVTIGGIDESKIEVLHNSITIESNFSEIDKNLSSNAKVFCLCNYIPSKRIHCLVQIAQSLNMQMDFNGTPSTSTYLSQLESLDAKNLCLFGGPITGVDKEKKLRNAKVLVLPSLNEGMPLVILESLAQGTPVICYNIGYISDYLGLNYPGLVKELSDEALAKKINWLYSLSEYEYDLLRRESFELFWCNFSPEKVCFKTIEIFNSLTHKRK